MKLIDYKNIAFYSIFQQYLQKYRKGISLDKNSEKEFWDFFQEGFKQGRNEVLDIFNKLNEGLQSEKIL